MALQKKYTGDVRNPFEIERTLDKMQPTSEQEHKDMLLIIEQLEKSNNLSDEEKKALVIWKTNLLAESIKPHVEKRFTHDFHAWLLGRGRPEDIKNTPWKTQPLVDDPEVRAYVDLFIDKNVDYHTALQKLAMKRPVGIAQCYLYYKYLVRDGKKEGTVFDVDFLKDWVEFGKDFDRARKAGQGPWNPSNPYNMAPYGSEASKAGKKYDDDHQLPPQFRGKKPSEVKAAKEEKAAEHEEAEEEEVMLESSSDEEGLVDGDDGKEIVGEMREVAKEFSSAIRQAMDEFARARVVQQHPAMVEQVHQQSETATRAEIAKLQAQIAAMEKERLPAEVTQRLPAHPVEIGPVQVDTGPLVKQVESLEKSITAGRELVEASKTAQAEREKELGNAVRSITTEVQKIQTEQKETAKTITDMSRLLEATGIVLGNMRLEQQKAAEAYKNGALDQNKMIESLDKYGAQVSEMMKNVAESQKKLPMLIEGFAAQQQATQALIVANAEKQVIQAGTDENKLREALQKSMLNEINQGNRDLAAKIAGDLETAARNLGQEGLPFLQQVQGFKASLAAASAGLPKADAERFVTTMYGSYQAFLKQLDEQRRAQWVKDTTKTPEVLRLEGAKQAEMLENTVRELVQSQTQALTLIAEEKTAQARAHEAEAKRQALELTAIREEMRKQQGILAMERAQKEEAQKAVREKNVALNKLREQAEQAVQAARNQAAQANQNTGLAIQQVQKSAEDAEKMKNAAKVEVERARAAAQAQVEYISNTAAAREQRFMEMLQKQKAENDKWEAYVKELERRVESQRAVPQLPAPEKLPELPGPAGEPSPPPAAVQPSQEEQELETAKQKQKEAYQKSQAEMSMSYLKTLSKAQKRPEWPQLDAFDKSWSAEEMALRIQDWRVRMNTYINKLKEGTATAGSREPKRKEGKGKRTAEDVAEEKGKEELQPEGEEELKKKKH